MMRVVDYVADYMYAQGVHEIFMLTGGGAMFLNDGVAKHPHLKAICNHHEQACAMAAVGYAKYTGGIGAACLTTGCGGTNAVTGLLDAWQDNVPCVFISGQVKRKETVYNSNVPLRQVGVQEANIIPVVQSLTKYAVMINNPEDIAYHFDKAVYLATTGRKGPVWLDIPLDVQGALIDETKLRRFNPDEIQKDYKEEPTQEEMVSFYEMLRTAERPLIIAGNGIRLGNAIPQFKSFIEKYSIPFVVSYLGVDLLPSNHPLYVGRVGIKGDRAGNFAMQNADLIIALGTRLCVPMTGYEYRSFARKAKVVVVDIDPNEHKKNTIRIDHCINADVKNFLSLANIEQKKDTSEWITRCKKWQEQWPICLPSYKKEKHGINMYYCIQQLAQYMGDNATVVSDAGSAYYVTAQALQIKEGQRHITSGAQADMGFTIPAAIGVCVAQKKGDVIGITGDGSFQLNLQELQTIVHNELPIKIFVWNNDGYLSIRATQAKFFEGRRIGTDKDSGISFPSLKKIAAAYGIQYCKVSRSSKLDETIQQVLACPSAVICEVISPPNQEVIPTVSSCKKEDGRMVSKPLEDMYPFLDRKVFAKEMIIPIEQEE